MIQNNNNNLSVLPWYTSINEQNHRKSYSFGDIYPLFTPSGFLLPFQLMREYRDNPIQEVLLYTKNGVKYADITSDMSETGLEIVHFQDLGYDVIVYPGIFPLSLTMYDGIYYARIYDGKQYFYSEMFTVVSDISAYLKIQWYDVNNLVFDAGQIVYSNPRFKNVLYLCMELGKPEYPFEEEGETMDGYFFPEKQISEKTYRCTFLAPEYLCDVMRLIRLADYVIVTDKYGRVYNCDTFLATPTWQTQGNLASVEVEFQTDTVVKKICRGYLPGNAGDYNSDFNNDFNKD